MEEAGAVAHRGVGERQTLPPRRDRVYQLHDRIAAYRRKIPCRNRAPVRARRGGGTVVLGEGYYQTAVQKTKKYQC